MRRRGERLASRRLLLPRQVVAEHCLSFRYEPLPFGAPMKFTLSWSIVRILSYKPLKPRVYVQRTMLPKNASPFMATLWQHFSKFHCHKNHCHSQNVKGAGVAGCGMALHHKAGVFRCPCVRVALVNLAALVVPKSTFHLRQRQRFPAFKGSVAMENKPMRPLSNDFSP